MSGESGGVGMSGELRDIRVTRGIRVRRPYWRLLQKEVSQALPMFLVVTAGIIAWHGYLFTRIGKWPVEGVVSLAFMPMGAIPLWLLWRSFSTLRQEWTGNHMYLLLALPIPGWYIASVKALVVVVEATVYGLVTGGGALLLASATGLLERMPIEFIQMQWGPMVLGTVASFMWPFTMVIVIQFSYIAGRLASRWSGFISAVTFVLSMWFIVRMGSLLATLLRWLPEVPVPAQGIVDGIPIQTAVYLKPGPAIGMLVAVLALFLFGSSFLERDVEL